MEEITPKKTRITTISKEEFLAKILSKKKIANTTINDKIVIDRKTLLMNSLIFVNCTFEDEIDIKNNSKIDIIFIDCNFKKRLFIVGENYINVQLTKCNFNLFVSFKKLFCENLHISQCSFKNKLLTQLQDFNCKKFEFINNNSLKDFQFKPQEVDEIYFEGSESNYLVTFYGSSKVIHKSIMLFNYSNNRTNFIISDFTTEKFRIFGDLKDSKIHVNKGVSENFLVDKFNNYGNFIINDIKSNSENSILVVNESFLGKVQLNNIDFNSFQRVILKSTNLLEIIPVNVIWCKNEILNSNALKEIYRQLKIVSIKNEDLISKHYFSKLEMENILNSQKFTYKNFNDYSILITNKFSNDFGLNWVKTFKIYLTLSLVFYTLIKFCLGYYYFNSDLILDEIGFFLNFINPLHQFDKVFNIPNFYNTNGALLIDGISKIINGYLLYQLVSSFRKYSNK